MRGVPFGVAIVAAGLYLLRLGQAPFLDPPEGFHTEIAHSIGVLGDWMTLHVDGIGYFDAPPVLYWLMALAFPVAGGPTEFAARLWPALAAVGTAAVTARLGVLLGGARVGMLAGLMVVANLGMYLYGRIVKPDMLFILCLVLAYAGFAVAYKGGGRWALMLFYASLGLATLTKDVLGALGPLAVVGMFFLLTRERPLTPWVPWSGILILLAIAAPWYAAMEWHHPGFLRYTLIDTHLSSFRRQRVFPDEAVALGALPFLGVTFVAFLPWAVAAPWGVARALRRPWEDASARLWVLIALWPVIVVGFFTLWPFRLPHDGLPAFPALALLVARVWDESIDAAPGALHPRALIMPLVVVFALATLALGLAAVDRLPLPAAVLGNLDPATRTLDAYAPVVRSGAVIIGAASVALAWAAWARRPALAVWSALAATLAFLPLAGDGMTQFSRSRSTRPIAEALALRLQPGDGIVHEGPLEHSASVLLFLDRRVWIVNGAQSSVAYGARSPEARDRFWDGARLQEEWTKPGRRFLISGVEPARSVVRLLPADRVHTLVAGGGRWLYSNVGD